MKVAPSILSVIDENLQSTIEKLNHIGLTYLHLDVMDGVFVPNTTFDWNLVKTIKQNSKLIIDTHLMIDKPEETIDNYLDTESDYLVFHIEATTKTQEIINKVKAKGKKVGISIKPKTPVDEIIPYLDSLDLVLVMSVEPGFGGQKFMEDMLDKVRLLKTLREQKGYKYLIEIDGGINNVTAPLAKEAGCDIVVAGTYFFKNPDLAKTVEELESL